MWQNAHARVSVFIGCVWRYWRDVSSSTIPTVPKIVMGFCEDLFLCPKSISFSLELTVFDTQLQFERLCPVCIHFLSLNSGSFLESLYSMSVLK